VGTLAHAATTAVITTDHMTRVRTHSLAVLAYNIMTLAKPSASKATGLAVFGSPEI